MLPEVRPGGIAKEKIRIVIQGYGFFIAIAQQCTDQVRLRACSSVLHDNGAAPSRSSTHMHTLTTS
jgi:hypothetical protein